MTEMLLTFRALLPTDPPLLEQEFRLQGWHKPATLYETYLNEQSEKKRDVIVAILNENFAGYVTIIYSSMYKPFREKGIPEISDLNVLKKYQGIGIGSSLMIQAEKLIAQKSLFSGIGVGLLQDYGYAQKLYFKLGYCPDGLGITYQYRSLEFGTKITLDDDAVLWLVKKLN